MLQKDLKKYVLPILEHSTVEMETLRGRELFGLRIESRDQALEQLIRGHDPWLKACALFSCIGTRSPELERLIEEAQTDPDPIRAGDGGPGNADQLRVILCVHLDTK